MYQIDNSTAAATIPASTSAGTPGFFTDGNPATGVAATIMPAEFMNMLMMEIMNVLAAAGVSPSKSNFTQLLTAIRAVGRQSAILTDTGTAGVYAATNTPALTSLPASGHIQRVNIANLNPGASTYSPDGLAAKPIYGLALQPLQGGELPGGIAIMMYLVQAGVNGGNGAWIILESLGGTQQVAPATKSQHAVQMSQLFGGLKGLQKFTSGGTLVVPVGVTTMYASGCGGGGGGGGSGAVSGVTSSWSCSGGGGGGDTGTPMLRQAFTVTPGQTLTIAIGAGGGGAGGGSAGSGGGIGANGGATTITGTGVSLTMAGGVGGGGGGGVNGINNAAGTAGANGGPSAQSGQLGLAVSGYSYNSGGAGGSGGSGPFGSGGGGKSTGTATPGQSGSGYGGGGAGACGTVSNSALLGAAGGTGSNGVVFIEW